MTTATDIKALYRAYSTANDFPHWGRRYNGVRLSWFVERRERMQVSPWKAIKEWSSLKGKQGQHYGEWEACALVKEMLTAEEVEALRDYLKRAHEVDVEAKEYRLPIETVSPEYRTVYLPLGGHPVGGAEDFYMLHREDGYDLPVKIEGYFDVEDCPDENGRPAAYEDFLIRI